jgi:hypothetical protein
MNAIKGSLAGLVLAGLLAIAPTAAFARGGGGFGGGAVILGEAPASGAATSADSPGIVWRFAMMATLDRTFSTVVAFFMAVPAGMAIPMAMIIPITATTMTMTETTTMKKRLLMWGHRFLIRLSLLYKES